MKSEFVLSNKDRTQVVNVLACYLCDIEVVLSPNTRSLQLVYRLDGEIKATINHLGTYLSIDPNLSANEVDRWLVDRFHRISKRLVASAEAMSEHLDITREETK